MPDNLSPEQDAIADTITNYLDDRPGKTFTASQLARVAKCTTPAAKNVLGWLLHDQFIAATGHGAWTRYTSRRA